MTLFLWFVVVFALGMLFGDGSRRGGEIGTALLCIALLLLAGFGLSHLFP